MKYLLLLLNLFFCYQVSSFSQALDTLWTKTFGGTNDEFGYFVEETNDGGYILTGWTKSFGTGLNDIWLIKTNAMGNILWSKTFGGSQDDNSSCVHQTTDGGFIIFGETASFGSTYWKAWLIKTNASGDTSWTKLLGQYRHYFIQSGQQRALGGYIFVGYSKATATGQEDIWLVKTDASGDTMWTKTFGGNESDLGNSIMQTRDSKYIIAGSTKSFGAGNYDIWLIRTDTEGDTLWTKTFGGSDYDYANDVKQTEDGGFIIAGSTKSFGYANNYTDVWLIKTDYNGDTLWTKTFGGTENDGCFSVQQTLDSGYIIAGYTQSFGAGNYDVWLIKTDASGNTLWTKTFGGNYWDTGRCVQQTRDGGFIIVGDRYTTSAVDYNIWLIKTTADINDVESPDQNIIPDKFILEQNYPNPFNPITKISWQSPVGSWQTLKVYDVLGNEITTLVDEYKPAGRYEVEFNSAGHSGNVRNLPSGVYFYQLLVSTLQSKDGKAGEFISTKKMVLIK